LNNRNAWWADPLRSAYCFIPALLCILSGAAPAEARSAGAPCGGVPRFEVTFDPGVSDKPYSGRVYLMLNQGAREPREAVGWFSTDPLFSKTVENWKPGEALTLDPADMMDFPKGAAADLAAGKYQAQAVIDLNGWSHEVLNAAGNGYSEPVAFEQGADGGGTIKLAIDHKVPDRNLKDTDELKYVRLRSKLLSDFHKRDVHLQAAVALPRDYADEADRRYPTTYLIDGFGGNIDNARMMLRFMPFARGGIDLVMVYIDPDCPTGHHVWADSANNGPWGEALTTELIPHLEKEFRLIGEPDARYLAGHSSGGWSSLWLQVTYPDFFGGVWSSSPDPVDFAAFQTVDIYAGDNMYTHADGSTRPVSREMPGGRQLMTPVFDRLEQVLGRGGQLQSFEAVFSPRGADGEPMKLWSRESGKVDPKIAEAWRKYDIRLILERDWKTLGPKLAGKLYLYCGDQDTFYLEKAFFKLRDALQRLGSDAKIEIIEGAGHGLPRTVFLNMGRQMAEHFRQRYPDHAEPVAP
jgi:S-formylglutathione hydrolase FrmB